MTIDPNYVPAPPPPPPPGPSGWKKLTYWQQAAILIGVPCMALVLAVGVIGAALAPPPEDDTKVSSQKAHKKDTSTPTPASEPATEEPAVEESEAPEPAEEPAEVVSEKPESEEPELKPTQLEEMEDAADDSDAEGVKVEKTGRGVWLVTFDVRENLSRGLTRDGIAIDVWSMAEQFTQEIEDKTANVRDVTFDGQFALIDVYGNEDKGRVFLATFSGATMTKINYDNMPPDLDAVEQLSEGGIFILPDLAR